MMPQICLRKFCGVHLYSVDTTRHYADIEMTDMPVDFPYVFGIPADKPRASVAEAEAWAIDTIAAYMLADRRGEGHNPPQMNTALFALDDVTFAIPRDIVDTMARQGYWSEKRASAQLDRVRQSMGGKATGDGLAKLEPGERQQLHIALVSNAVGRNSVLSSPMASGTVMPRHCPLVAAVSRSSRQTVRPVQPIFPESADVSFLRCPVF